MWLLIVSIPGICFLRLFTGSMSKRLSGPVHASLFIIICGRKSLLNGHADVEVYSLVPVFIYIHILCMQVASARSYPFSGLISH